MLLSLSSALSLCASHARERGRGPIHQRGGGSSIAENSHKGRREIDRGLCWELRGIIPISGTTYVGWSCGRTNKKCPHSVGAFILKCIWKSGLYVGPGSYSLNDDDNAAAASCTTQFRLETNFQRIQEVGFDSNLNRASTTLPRSAKLV